MITLNKKDIINLLPHREPMLLIDELSEIQELSSATAIVKVRKDLAKPKGSREDFFLLHLLWFLIQYQESNRIHRFLSFGVDRKFNRFSSC